MLRFIIKVTPWLLAITLSVQAGSFCYTVASAVFGWQTFEERLIGLGCVFFLGASIIALWAFVSARLVFGLWLETYRLADLLKGVSRGLIGGPIQWHDGGTPDTVEFRRRLRYLFWQFFWMAFFAIGIIASIINGYHLYPNKVALASAFIGGGMGCLFLTPFLFGWNKVCAEFPEFLPPKLERPKPDGVHLHSNG